MTDSPDWNAGDDDEKLPEVMIQIMALVFDPLGVARRRWIWILLALVVGIAGTAAFVSQLEPTYESQAKVVITSQQIPEDFVRSTVREDSFSNMNAMVGEVLSHRNLQSLIERRELYPEQREQKNMSELVGQMRSNITIRPEQAYQKTRGPVGSSILVVKFVYTNPGVTAEVADELASMFVNASLRRRSEQARTTTEFLKRELRRAESELAEATARVTEYTRAHRGELPSDMTTHLNRLERLNARRTMLVEQIDDADDRVAALQARRDAPSSPEAALVELRLRLAHELSLNTDEHPNVISLRRRIALLEDEVSEISQLSATAEDTADIEYEAALKERQDLRAQLAEVEAELTAIDARIDQIPERTNELTALEQRSAVLRATYLDFMQKVQDAELAEELESAQQGPRVTLLDRAQVPVDPMRRPIMFLIPGIVGSFVFAAAIGVLLELIDPVVLSGDHLEAVGEQRMLGVINRTA